MFFSTSLSTILIFTFTYLLSRASVILAEEDNHNFQEMKYEWEGYIYEGADADEESLDMFKHFCISGGANGDPSTPQHITMSYCKSRGSNLVMSGFIRRGPKGESPYFIGRIRDPYSEQCLTYHSPSTEKLPVNRAEQSVTGDIRGFPCRDQGVIHSAQQMVIPIPFGARDYAIFPANGPKPESCDNGNFRPREWMPTIFFGTDRYSRVEVGCGKTRWKFYSSRGVPFFKPDPRWFDKGSILTGI